MTVRDPPPDKFCQNRMISIHHSTPRMQHRTQGIGPKALVFLHIQEVKTIETVCDCGHHSKRETHISELTSTRSHPCPHNSIYRNNLDKASLIKTTVNISLR